MENDLKRILAFDISSIYLEDETTAFLVFINNIKDNSKSTFTEGGKGTV